MDITIGGLLTNDGAVCPSCGRRHFGMLKECIIGSGTIERLPGLVKKLGGTTPYILCDSNTYSAAGSRVIELLDENGIDYDIHIIQREHPMPDEITVGEAVMYCRPENDIVIGVGGGVINDTSKIIASQKKVPEIIVATAPSMDGFASATSSVDRNGLKVSIATKCPEAVIGDTDILSRAPAHLIRSGVGDMLAKYVSIVEWKISNIINGEYFCPHIEEIVKSSLEKCVSNTSKALQGDREAVASVMEGLVISGLCMNYAGVSRPASGMEHYISHIIDMKSLEFGTKCDLHGIQCGIATLRTVREYEKLADTVPDRERAVAHADGFDTERWNSYLVKKLGRGACAIIEGDSREQKYDTEKHSTRIDKIIGSWDEIRNVISELPSSRELEKFMKDNGIPTSPSDIGLTDAEMEDAFIMAKDIRDKYVLGKLLWDLGRI